MGGARLPADPRVRPRVEGDGLDCLFAAVSREVRASRLGGARFPLDPGAARASVARKSDQNGTVWLRDHLGPVSEPVVPLAGVSASGLRHGRQEA